MGTRLQVLAGKRNHMSIETDLLERLADRADAGAKEFRLNTEDWSTVVAEIVSENARAIASPPASADAIGFPQLRLFGVPVIMDNRSEAA